MKAHNFNYDRLLLGQKEVYLSALLESVKESVVKFELIPDADDGRWPEIQAKSLLQSTIHTCPHMYVIQPVLYL